VVYGTTATCWKLFALQADLTDAEVVNEVVLRIQPEVVVHLAVISFVGYGVLC